MIFGVLVCCGILAFAMVAIMLLFLVFVLLIYRLIVLDVVASACVDQELLFGIVFTPECGCLNRRGQIALVEARSPQVIITNLSILRYVIFLLV